MATTTEMAEAAMTMLRQLDALWQATDNAGRRDQISHEMDALQDTVMRLMAENSKQAGAEYDRALAAFDKANAQLKKTIDDLNKIAEAVELAAKAIDLATKLLP